MIYGRKWPEYAAQWDRMVINPNRVEEAKRAAQYAIDHIDVYQAIYLETSVHWVLTACTHRRESDDQDKHGNPLFTSYLGNGQPLWIKTTIEPKGRGPFCAKMATDKEMTEAFINGAKDAYAIDRLDRVKDWRLEKMLFYSEVFNGTGYHERGLPSAYIWGGTNIQQRGKFISDHKFDSRYWDKQLGVAPIMKMISELEGTIQYTRED